MEIEGFEDYLIYEDGRVWSKKKSKGRFLKHGINNIGYVQVTLCKDGKTKTKTIHRLLGKAYIPNPENKPEIDHIDNNRQNNNISNLRWVTKRENQLNKGAYGEVKFKGVYKHGNRFRAHIAVDGKMKHIGCYDTAEEAAEAYKNY